MKHPPRVIALSLIGSGVLAAFAGPASAAPTAPIVPTVSAASPASAAAYWTPGRMQAAKPLGLPKLDASAIGTTTEEAEKIVNGVVQKVDPTALPVGPGVPWTGGGKVTHTAGRIFFKLKGQDASCSGDAVSSKNKSVVVTAGHCVKYEGSWETNWVFVPGYHDGKRPYGTWPAKKLMTTPQWSSSENLSYDVGMAVVGTRGGKHLTQAVGGQGIAFNQARGAATYAFGYPAETPYDGEKLIYCNGPVIDDPLGTSNDQGIACLANGGASGGPWFEKFNTSTGTGYQTSVNSFKYTFDPAHMFGPYFGKVAQSLYKKAQSS